MGGSCAQADKPEIQEPGRPEGLPRTAAIARNYRHKKTPANRDWGRWCACILSGYQARSLNWQRRGEVSVVGGGVQLEKMDPAPFPEQDISALCVGAKSHLP